VGVEGTYTVLVTDQRGCQGTDDGFLTIHDNPVVTVDDTDVCEGFDTQMCAVTTGGLGPYTFDWDGPGGFDSADSCITVGVQGTYSVLVTDQRGCQGTDDGFLTVNPGLTIVVDDNEACDGFSAQLCAQVSGGTSPFTFDWDGPGGFDSADSCITVDVPGRYTCYVVDDEGCDGTDFGDLTIHDNPVVTVDDKEACDGFTAQLCAVTSGGLGPYTFDWDGPGGFDSADSCITVGVQGTYTVLVTDQNGCQGTDDGFLTIHDNPVVTVNDNEACDGFTAPLCAQVSGGEWPYTFDWDGPGGFDSADSCITVDVEGTYTCYVTDSNDCEGSDDGLLTIHPNPVCSLTAPDPLPECGSDGNTLEGPAGMETYAWEILDPSCGWVITDGADEQIVTYSAGDECDVTFKLTITDENDCEGMCQVTFTCTPPPVEEFCTFTQGFYGNEGGKFNGIPTLDLIKALITPDNPLVVGVPGSDGELGGLLGGDGRSVTWEGGESEGYEFEDCPEEPNGDPGVAEHCIIERLPAGGTPSELPMGLGDVFVDPSDCDTDPPVPTQNGKYDNVLLGQTIALSLNSKLDENLGDLGICPMMKTVSAMPGPDGCLGTEDDVAGADTSTFYIPQSVLDALENESLDQTVAGLLALANRALAGMSTGGAGLSAISSAASKINEGFDECRFLIYCGEMGTGEMVGTADETIGVQPVGAIPTAFSLGMNYPNPVHQATVIRFALPERSEIHLAVYDIIGREIVVLLEGSLRAGYHTASWDAVSRSEFAAGVYFYKMEAVGLATGQEFRQTRKMLVVK
jgi:hypothetical protein